MKLKGVSELLLAVIYCGIDIADGLFATGVSKANLRAVSVTENYLLITLKRESFFTSKKRIYLTIICWVKEISMDSSLVFYFIESGPTLIVTNSLNFYFIGVDCFIMDFVVLVVTILSEVFIYLVKGVNFIDYSSVKDASVSIFYKKREGRQSERIE